MAPGLVGACIWLGYRKAEAPKDCNFFNIFIFVGNFHGHNINLWG